MNNQEVQNSVCEVLGVAFELGKPVNPGFCREQQPAWDSLKHIEVVLALEDRFGIQFAEGEMPQLDSVSEITQRVSELL